MKRVLRKLGISHHTPLDLSLSPVKVLIFREKEVPDRLFVPIVGAEVHYIEKVSSSLCTVVMLLIKFIGHREPQ
jgi:hypothetical protein